VAGTDQLEFGLYLNNRGPLLSSNYRLGDLLELAEMAEELGLDSVWVGDGLLAQPRHDPLMLLAALAQRTARVRIGTAALRASLRDPLYLAMAWATIDHLAAGRTVLGVSAGNAVEAGVRREFAVQGIDHRDRMGRLEEWLEVLRQLWSTGRVTFEGRHFRYQNVTFSSGTEIAPLGPLQSPPPIWLVSNPWLGDPEPEVAHRSVDRAARRIVRLSDGWLTCCRAGHPEEVEEQVAAIQARAAEQHEDPDRFAIAYQVTVTLADSGDDATEHFARFIDAYYPEFGAQVDPTDWGPMGTPEDVVPWFSRFAEAGVTRFLVRLGCVDERAGLRRFVQEIVPAFRADNRSPAREGGTDDGHQGPHGRADP
jgi:alkanesulfonate monooxygenase SsuD/methylene tetrahydromethanopterin reductase-like flavin-dependent oxidoreductase (luciferase family)